MMTDDDIEAAAMLRSSVEFTKAGKMLIIADPDVSWALKTIIRATMKAMRDAKPDPAS